VITYLLRHGQTSLSASYRVNGDARLAVSLDETGREQCRRARAAIPVAEIRTCVSSEFSRAIETAKLILQDHALAEEAISFPEAPCATPMPLADADLRRTIDALITDLDGEPIATRATSVVAAGDRPTAC
jgi:broad specificity phosphatase PhoE